MAYKILGETTNMAGERPITNGELKQISAQLGTQAPVSYKTLRVTTEVDGKRAIMDGEQQNIMLP